MVASAHGIIPLAVHPIMSGKTMDINTSAVVKTIILTTS